MNYAIYNNGSAPSIRNVTTTASGGAYSYGIYNYNASTTMKEVTAEALGAVSANTGVSHNTYPGGSTTSVSMIEVTAIASGGIYNYGVEIFGGGGSSTMTNVSAIASDGSTNRAIRMQGYPVTAIMTGIHATAYGGSAENHGISIETDAAATIRSSTLEGTIGLWIASTATAKISSTTLIGGATGTTANISCIYVADENNNPLDANCLPIP